MNAAEVQTTTVFVQPWPAPVPPVAPVPVAPVQTEVRTVTVTVTPTSATLPTITNVVGVPWTTATPFRRTRTMYDYSDFSQPTAVHVFESYPPQPQWSRCYCRNPAGRIAGAFFGGMGAGMVILGILILIIKIKYRRWKQKKERRIMLEEAAETGAPDSAISKGSVKEYRTPRIGSPVARGSEEEAAKPLLQDLKEGENYGAEDARLVTGL